MSESLQNDGFYFERQQIPALFDNLELHDLSIRVALAVDMLRSQHGPRLHQAKHLASDCRALYSPFNVEGVVLDEDGKPTEEKITLTTRKFDKVTRKGVGIEIQSDGEIETIWLDAHSIRLSRDSDYEQQ